MLDYGFNILHSFELLFSLPKEARKLSVRILRTGL